MMQIITKPQYVSYNLNCMQWVNTVESPRTPSREPVLVLKLQITQVSYS